MNQQLVNHSFASTPAMSLRTNFGWTFLGNVVNALSLFGVLTVLARLGDPTMVGRFVLGLSIAAPVMAVTMLQLRNLVVTDARGQFTFADYFGTRVIWTVIGFIIIAAVAFVSSLDPETVLIVLLVGAAKCAESFSDMIHGLYQRLERMNLSGISMIVRGTVALTATALTMWLTRSLPWTTAALAASWALTFLLFDLDRARRLLDVFASPQIGTRLSPRFHRQTILQVTGVGLPLGIVMGIISLQTNFPRFILQAFEGERAVGYFGAMAYPMIAVGMIANALGQSSSPRLARYFVENPTAFHHLLTKLCLLAGGLGATLILGTVLLGRMFLRLYGEDYAMYHSAFIILSVATAIQAVASCWGYALTAARSLRIQVLLVTATSLLTFAAALLFVPRWGVKGGAMTTVVTSLMMLLLYWLATKRAMRHRNREAGVSTTDIEDSPDRPNPNQIAPASSQESH